MAKGLVIEDERSIQHLLDTLIPRKDHEVSSGGKRRRGSNRCVPLASPSSFIRNCLWSGWGSSKALAQDAHSSVAVAKRTLQISSRGSLWPQRTVIALWKHLDRHWFDLARNVKG